MSILIALLEAIQDRGTVKNDKQSTNLGLIMEMIEKNNPLITKLECELWDELQLSQLIDRMEEMLIGKAIFKRHSPKESDDDEFPLL